MTPERSVTRNLRDVAWIGAGCAMVATAYFLVRATGYLTLGGGFATVSRDVVWMAPLGNLIVFGMFVVPVAAVATVLARETAVRVAFGVFGALVLFGTLLPLGQVSRLAIVLLSIGIVVQLIRLLPHDPEAAVRLARRTAIGVAASCAVLAAVVATWRDIATWRDKAAMPTASANAANVLLIILDTVRASSLSLYGYGRATTPHLDAFARGGTVFETAIATAPWTLPSHASIFTGHYPAWLNTDFQRNLDETYPTLAELLRARGYYTFGVAANLSYTSWESGLDRGFTEYHDYPVNVEQILRSSLYGATTFADGLLRARRRADVMRVLRKAQFIDPPKHDHYQVPASEVADRYLEFLRTRDTTRPYFAFLNFFDAHSPYEPAERLRQHFGKPTGPRDLYDAEIFGIDEQLGRIFAVLDRSGALRNTIVVVASDHGEHFGERGLRRHANSVYTALVHVPLVIRFDGRVPEGQRISLPVSLRDLGRTMLDLTGASAVRFPGTSLASAWSETSASLSKPVALLNRVREDDPSIPASDTTMIAAFDERWHLVRSGRRMSEELFAYRTDTAEQTNLLGLPAAQTSVKALRAMMRDALLADRPAGHRRSSTVSDSL